MLWALEARNLSPLIKGLVQKVIWGARGSKHKFCSSICKESLQEQDLSARASEYKKKISSVVKQLIKKVIWGARDSKHKFRSKETREESHLGHPGLETEIL